jgi:ATPase components of various ABC-type transport systems, contain duplicated ATPase
MALPLISFEGYGFQYNAQKKPTLHNINLAIRKGEKVLIIGPSGSGKSTLAHCINGLIPFNYKGKVTGQLTVCGDEACSSSIFSLSKKVGTVLQDTDGQFVGLTAAEDIAFSLENNCVAQNEMIPRVQDAASLVGIGEYLDSSPFDLSGGQKQRVSMAGVIIDNVHILLFDEPLANLDPATGKAAIELIDKNMGETDTTVIIIEHRLEDVLYRHVDRIVLINDGRIQADLPPDEMLCSNLLTETGIREPLYLSALKYAGVAITPKHHPGYIDMLQLNKAEKQAVKNWLYDTHPAPTASHKELLLQVEHLSFSYEEEKSVLQDITFDVCAGDMLAIAGTNGAGKSTLAKLICGFEKVEKGRILLHGQDMESLTITERAEHIGYVMQNPNQMISKSMIFDEVALGLRSSGIPEEEVSVRVEETLKICGLYPFRNWPISALSFGQKKRVTIASVLVMSPEIIILDEPTAGQDFRHYTDIMEFLLQLNQQGVTVLMITHDMHLMLEYAHRALIFSGGRLLADSTAAQVLTNPDLSAKASLKETSLFSLAQLCGIENGAGFVQHFIDYDREARRHG